MLLINGSLSLCPVCGTVVVVLYSSRLVMRPVTVSVSVCVCVCAAVCMSAWSCIDHCADVAAR